MSWFDDEAGGSAVDVAVLMDSQVPDLLWQLVTDGALVSIGRTSDGGAVGVTVTLDGRWKRGYFRSVEDALDFLGPACTAVSEEAARLAASPGSRKRPRRSDR